ncbi:MAG TPA: DUF5372 family protein [Gemmatimonadales bacterium]|nr:DUF5372 family protein [Gemmatimonadales bacterium]
MTHPFHPLAGREFELVLRKANWAEDRVLFFDRDGQIRSVPAGWTDVDPPEPFDVVAAGRALFRTTDLVALADLIDTLRPPCPRRRVKRNPPKM